MGGLGAVVCLALSTDRNPSDWVPFATQGLPLAAPAVVLYALSAVHDKSYRPRFLALRVRISKIAPRTRHACLAIVAYTRLAGWAVPVLNPAPMRACRPQSREFGISR